MIRLATIGTSTITRRFLAAVEAVPGIAATMVYSRAADRAAAFAAEAGVGVASSDLDAVLRSGEVDAVYVGSPNAAHAAQVEAALRAGRHVFVEKPATPTADEFARLLALAREHGVVLFEGMRNVYDPGFRALGELLPQVGRLRRASLSYGQRSARYDRVLAGERVNIFDPAMAGGALLDLGVYCLAAAIELFGAPASVTAAAVPVASGVDGAGAALLGYDGFVVDVGYSKITFSDRPSEIQGEAGTVVIDRIAQPRSLTLTALDGSARVHEIAGAEDNMVYEVARFVELVDGGGDAASDQARTLATLEVVDRIRSAR